MSNQRNYSTQKAVSTALRIVLIAVIAFAVWASTASAVRDWDVEYPMTNAHIDWEQSFYPGPWRR